MLLFYHSQQAPSNANHCKGKLFEGLLGRYLSTSGYDVNFRVKHASLEYDLEGKHKVDRGKVVGEAKAHGRSISGEILTSFVGKLFPLGLHEGSVTGLFLSTSPLTAEAADYYSSISKFKVRVYTGEDLFAQVREALSLPKAENLEQQVCDQGYFPQASHLLASDTDIYTAVLAATADSAGPSHFAIFRSDGTRLVDTVFGNSLRDSVAELQSLEFIDSPIGSTALTGRTVASGLAVGSDW
ncbi:MAG: restriction endonuclease, partial [Myxococcota bacterium]